MRGVREGCPLALFSSSPLNQERGGAHKPARRKGEGRAAPTPRPPDNAPSHPHAQRESLAQNRLERRVARRIDLAEAPSVTEVKTAADCKVLERGLWRRRHRPLTNGRPHRRHKLVPGARLAGLIPLVQVVREHGFGTQFFEDRQVLVRVAGFVPQRPG